MADFASGFSPVKVIFQDGSVVVVTATTAQTLLKQFTLPGNSLGTDGIMIVRWLMIPKGNNSTKTVRVTIGGILVFSVPYQPLSQLPNECEWTMYQQGATGVQYHFFKFWSSNSETGSIASVNTFDSLAVDTKTAVPSMQVDLTKDQVIAFDVTLGNGADSLTMRSMTAYVIKA